MKDYFSVVNDKPWMVLGQTRSWWECQDTLVTLKISINRTASNCYLTWGTEQKRLREHIQCICALSLTQPVIRGGTVLPCPPRRAGQLSYLPGSSNSDIPSPSLQLRWSVVAATRCDVDWQSQGIPAFTLCSDITAGRVHLGHTHLWCQIFRWRYAGSLYMTKPQQHVSRELFMILKDLTHEQAHNSYHVGHFLHVPGAKPCG